MKNIKKVLLITNIPTPYRIPLYNEINTKLSMANIKFIVVFAAIGYRRRKWDIKISECKFKYYILDNKNIYKNHLEKSSFTYRGIFKIINKEKPNIIITTTFSIATTKLWLLSLVKPLRYIIWSGATHNHYNQISKIRILHRKLLIKRAKGFIAYGIKAKEYLIFMGADENKVSIGLNTVDTDYYRERVAELRGKIKPDNNIKHLLYIGELNARKNVHNLIMIVSELREFRSDIVLDVVGDGMELANLKAYVKRIKLDKFIYFHGYKQKSDLPFYMAKADCFLLQTEFDIWGLVLNEAMAAGLVCIASKNAGAVYDLIIDGSNGFIANFSNYNEVKEKINWILDNPQKAKIIGNSASIFIKENASIKKSTDGFIKAILGVI